MAILRRLCLFGTLFSAVNAVYTLRKSYDATNFFDDDSFNFYDGWDSFNSGFTIYVNKSTALSSGLAAITPDNQIYLGMDYQTKLTTGTHLGRNSIRLTAVEGFTTGLLVADIERMPSSICGVWNAYWLVRDWKGSFGEIDMVEQAFLARASWFNAYTMFEGQCQMKDLGGQVTPWATDCKIDPGSGCHANAPDGTYGDAFNAHNGGFFATQVEADGIKIWFFVRGTEPADINGVNPDTTKWGKPTMNLGVVDCDVKTIFREMQITLNTITCGTIGSWSSTGCDAKTGYPTCDAYVAANPAAFKEAYYLINSIKLYQDSVTVPQVASSTPTVSTLPSKTVANTAQATSSATTSSKGMTTDATCGGDNGLSCSGSPFGNCCSSYGWCGSTDAYCGQGCQSAFGDCTGQASSISASPAASKTSASPAPSTLSTVTAATTVATAASAKPTTCAPAPTTCGNVGMDFALQYHSWGDKTFEMPADPSIAVNVDYFKTASPAYVGTTTLTSFIGGNGANTDSKSFYGSPSFNPNLIAIHHRGYIYAKYSGTYTFSIDLSDNQVVLWLGSKAYTGWEKSNADSTNQYNNNPTADITLQLEACSYTPVRVLSINGNGPMTFQFSVTDPKGYQIIGPSSVANDGVLKFACDSTLAPAFPAFGKE